ncbi:MAG: DUF5123 domain-containing protein [Prolixibacteraceae bacterium]
MRKSIKTYLYATGLAILLALSACQENIAPVIDTMTFDRLFIPLKLTARVMDKVNVQLSWDKMNGADAYVVELSLDSMVYQSIVASVTVKPEEIPFTYSLEGETQYTARVKSISNQGIADSKWATVVFTTDAEQIIKEAKDITGTGATITWTAGLNVTQIVFSPGDIKHDITPAEKAAGEAVLTGLAAETDYTAKILNGAKQRGMITFKTLLDLGGSTPVYDGDNLIALLDAASDGDSFVIFPGTFDVGNYAITKNVKIRGLYPTNKPEIDGRFTFGVDLSSVIFENIILNGVDALTYSNPLQFSAAATVGLISFEGCVIKNYKSHLFYDSSQGATLGEFKLSNCIVDNILGNGGDGFDFRSSCVQKLTYQNTTFSNGFRSFLRLDYTGPLSMEVTVDHCTFYRVCSFDNSNNIGLIRVNGAGAPHTVTFSNNILYGIGGDTALGFMSKGKISATTTVVLNNNDYFASPTLWTNAPFLGVAKDFDAKAMELDPLFKDAASGDFTVGEYTLSSGKIGDPRWY